LPYRRWTDEELAEQLNLDLEAKANNAIEGLYADAAEDALFAMRAAGVQSISLPRLDSKSDLDCVMAIGKASQQVLKTLPDDDVAKARALVSVASAASDEGKSESEIGGPQSSAIARTTFCGA
jgi:hypothetical protein